MLLNKFSDARERFTAVGEPIRKQMPHVNHLVPFLESDLNARCLRFGGKPHAIVAEPETRERLPFTTVIDRHAVVNVNVGGEYLVLTWLSLAGGFYTDFSSAPKIKESLTADQPARVNLYGLTMSAAYISQHVITRLGLLYSVGSGLDVRPASDLTRLGQGSTTFVTQDITQSFLYLFVSTTFRY